MWWGAPPLPGARARPGPDSSAAGNFLKNSFLPHVVYREFPPTVPPILLTHIWGQYLRPSCRLFTFTPLMATPIITNGSRPATPRPRGQQQGPEFLVPPTGGSMSEHKYPRRPGSGIHSGAGRRAYAQGPIRNRSSIPRRGNALGIEIKNKMDGHERMVGENELVRDNRCARRLGHPLRGEVADCRVDPDGAVFRVLATMAKQSPSPISGDRAARAGLLSSANGNFGGRHERVHRRLGAQQIRQARGPGRRIADRRGGAGRRWPMPASRRPTSTRSISAR